MDLPGRPISFVTTDNFLRCFSMESLADLPPVHSEAAVEALQQQLDEEELFEE